VPPETVLGAGLSGAGTAADPYLVSSQEDLLAVSGNPKAYYRMTGDIALTAASWTPVCHDTAFSGVFDGGGHTVSGLVLEGSGYSHNGLFGQNAGTIRNLTVQGTVNSTGRAGLLAGGTTGTVENCFSGGTVTAAGYAGGLVGESKGALSACGSDAKVTSTGSYAGGLVGYGNDSTAVKNCYARSGVSGKSASGGLAGRLYFASLRNCYAAGTVSGGGLAGTQKSSTVTSSYYDATLSGQTDTDRGTPLSTADMKLQSSYAGWDFTSVWSLSAGINDGYPHLRAAAPGAPVPVTGVRLDRSAMDLSIGASKALTATVLPAGATDKAVTWTSSNPSVAAVTDGVVTGRRAGTAVITVTARDGNRTDCCTVTVTEAPAAVTGVTLDKSALRLAAGETAMLSASVQPVNAANKTLSWSSSDETVATVSGGRVRALKAGTAAITVTASDGGHTAQCAVTVTAPAAAVTALRLAGPASAKNIQGQPLDLTGLTVTAVYSDGSEKTATDYTVSGYHAEKLGSQTVTVSHGGKTASFTVTVERRRLESVSVTRKPEKLAYAYGDALDLAGMEVTARYNDGGSRVLKAGEYSCAGYDPKAPGTQTLTVAYEENCDDSTVLAADVFTVTVGQQAVSGDTAKPQLSIESFAGGKYVTLTAEAGAVIRYTTDGGVPGASSPVCSGPITLTQTKTVRAIAVKAGAQSGVTSARVSVSQTGAPAAFTAETGKVTAGSVVTFRSDTAGSAIYYTVGGGAPVLKDGVPGEGTYLYGGAVVIREDMARDGQVVLKAVAVKGGWQNSAVTAATYGFEKTQRPMDAVTVSLGAVRADAGAPASVPVYLFTDSDSVKISSFQIALTFDKDAFENAVTLTPAEGVDPSRLFLSVNGGRLSLLYTGAPLDSGEVCTLNFTSLASRENTKWPVRVDLGGTAVSTGKGTDVDLSVMDGRIELGKARLPAVTGEVVYTAKDGTALGQGGAVDFSKETEIEASFSVSETTASGANVYLVIYDRQNRMASVDTWKVNVSDPSFLFIQTIRIPKDVEVGAIKLMVLSDTMAPLMAASELAK